MLSHLSQNAPGNYLAKCEGKYRNRIRVVSRWPASYHSKCNVKMLMGKVYTCLINVTYAYLKVK